MLPYDPTRLPELHRELRRAYHAWAEEPTPEQWSTLAKLWYAAKNDNAVYMPVVIHTGLDMIKHATCVLKTDIPPEFTEHVLATALIMQPWRPWFDDENYKNILLSMVIDRCGGIITLRTENACRQFLDAIAPLKTGIPKAKKTLSPSNVAERLFGPVWSAIYLGGLDNMQLHDIVALIEPVRPALVTDNAPTPSAASALPGLLLE